MNKLALHISTWKVKVTVLYPHEYISKHNTDRSKLPMLRTELFMKVLWSVPQSCLTLCDPMDCNQTPFEHRIFQARMLEWVAMLSSSGSSQHRGRTQVSCIAGRFFTIWTTREASWFLNQGLLNSRPWQWKLAIPATGPLGNSPYFVLIKIVI